MSGVWVLRTEPWVTAHPLLRHDLWKIIRELDGVAALDDAEVLSLETVKEWLPPALSLVRRKRKIPHG